MRSGIASAVAIRGGHNAQLSDSRAQVRGPATAGRLTARRLAGKFCFLAAPGFEPASSTWPPIACPRKMVFNDDSQATVQDEAIG
jgi:hypothetical protein